MNIMSHSLYNFALIEADQILLFQWTPETSRMNYEDFQEACQNYAGFAWEHQVKRLLVDTRIFNYALPEAYVAWREAELNPRYHKLGIEKFAYIMPEEALPHLEDIDPADGTFVTRYFGDQRPAVAWLLA